MVIILDNIRSAANVGSIFRTADALGASRIFLAGITPEPVDRFGNVRSDIKKVSLGSEEQVPWEKIGTSGKTIKKLKKDGFRILAVEQSKNSVPYYRIGAGKKFEKIALVLGSETSGLSESILSKADGILEIPMRGMKESLNVAVAFGIVGFHLRYAHG